VFRLAVAKEIVRIVAGVAWHPELKITIPVELVCRRMPGTLVEPVDEYRRIEPTDGSCWLVGTAIVVRDAQTAQGIGLINHLLGNFVLSDPVRVRYRSGRVGIARGIRRIPGIADRDELD